jgi:hypothetical protein
MTLPPEGFRAAFASPNAKGSENEQKNRAVRERMSAMSCAPPWISTKHANSS